MIRRRLVTLISVIVLSSVTLGLGACASGSTGGSGGAAPTPTPIPTSIVPTNPTYEVQRGDVIRLLQFSGRIAPVREEELFFKTNGYVQSVYVGRNDDVQEGDLLAELEVTDLKNQITQQEAELQAVKMDQERNLSNANNSVRAAELRLAKLQASQDESSLLNAQINVDRARQRLADAQDEYNKSLDRNWERPEVREAYAKAVADAQIGVEQAEAAYRDTLRSRERLQYDIELASMDLDSAKMNLAEVQTGLNITRTQLSLDRLNDQLNDARIVAPFTGVILQINLLEGKQIQGYAPVMMLADPTELEVSADLQDSEMSELSEGMQVEAEFVNRPGETYPGVIRRLPYPYGGGGRTDSAVQEDDKSVRITLENMDSIGTFTIGDRLRMTSELERSENTLWLPPQAVRTFEGRSFVVIQEGGAQRRVDVRLGIKADDRVEILDGLTEGQVVIAP